MLELLGSGLLSLWLEAVGVYPPAPPDSPPALNLLLLKQPEPEVEAVLEQYLQQLSERGFAETGQGIWVQSSDNLLGQHVGDQPLPAASLTKVATTLVALRAWGPQHRFITQVGATGPIRNGVLEGDLVIRGQGDPLLVWEEAFSLGNALNQLGLKRVTGNLVIVDKFAMNYETDPAIAGELLRQALDASLWSGEAADQFTALPPGTPRPKVVIAGQVQSAAIPPQQQTLLINHQSLPLFEILKQMNIYSNNEIAEILAAQLGGGPKLAVRAANAAQVPQNEIQLINGSGLGHENRISPRAVCGMFQAIQLQVQPYKLTIADLFPMAGQTHGTLSYRKLPQATLAKTGTLWDVSALAGVIPTQKYGPVWFAVINRGDGLDGFRDRQDQLLQTLIQQWGTPTVLPPDFQPQLVRDRLGDASRNQILLPPAPTPSATPATE